MAKAEQTQGIPTELSAEQFRQFVLPHLTLGRRGPPPRLSLHTLFNYILRVLYMGCQWKELPIQKDGEGRSEIHYPYLWRLSKVAGRWLFRCDFHRDRTEPSSCRPPRHYRHPRRWHDDSGEERRRQRRVQRTQEDQRRQGRCLLRSQLQYHRAICRRPGKSQRIAALARSLANGDANRESC